MSDPNAYLKYLVRQFESILGKKTSPAPALTEEMWDQHLKCERVKNILLGKE